MSGDKLYSMDQLNLIGDGNDEFITSILTTFLQSIPQNAAELAAASGTQDWDKVYFLAHKMKPSIALLEIRSIHDEIIVVEQNARNKTELESIPPLVTHIHEVINQTVVQIKEDFGL